MYVSPERGAQVLVPGGAARAQLHGADHTLHHDHVVVYKHIQTEDKVYNIYKTFTPTTFQSYTNFIFKKNLTIKTFNTTTFKRLK